MEMEYLFMIMKNKIYEGQWKNDEKNGHGKKINKKKNSIYEGNWKSNKRHGNGKLNVDDKIFFQNFKNGVLLSSVDEASVVGDIDVETDHQINLIEEQKLKLKQNIIFI